MKILFLMPGPSYRIASDAFQLKYKYLSRYISGYVITTSGSLTTTSIGNIKCLAFYHNYGLLHNIKYIAYCIITVLHLKRTGYCFDLIVTYDPIKTGLIGLILKLILKCKLIVEVNGAYNSPHVWEYDNNKKASFAKRWICFTLIKTVLSFADGIKLLFPTQIDEFNISCDNKVISVYPDWVNTELFSNIEDRPEILFVGFPFKIKGVDILIRAFKLIADKYPDWRLKILGWYPDMKELNSEIDGHPQIFHHPPVTGSQMPDHIGRCGFLILPSRTEAMGRVLVEAMAAGKARIGSRVDGIPTVIDDGVDGLLVESEDVFDLSSKMDMLISDPDLRKKLGDAAKERVNTEFTPDQYLKATFNFYDKVLN